VSKNGVPYDDMSDLEAQFGLTIVQTDKDYGPVMKIMGPLLSDEPDDTIMVSFDDDVLYHPELVSYYLKTFELHGRSAAIGNTGLFLGERPIKYHGSFNKRRDMKIPDGGKKTDILYGYGGVMYKRSFFPRDPFPEFINLAFTTPSLFINDDVLISGYLSKQGIDRILINTPVTKEEDDHLGEGTGISARKAQFMERFTAAVNTAEMEFGMFSERAPFTFDTFNHIYTNFIIIIILVIVLVLLLWWISSYR